MGTNRGTGPELPNTTPQTHKTKPKEVVSLPRKIQVVPPVSWVSPVCLRRLVGPTQAPPVTVRRLQDLLTGLVLDVQCGVQVPGVGVSEPQSLDWAVCVDGFLSLPTGVLGGRGTLPDRELKELTTFLDTGSFLPFGSPDPSRDSPNPGHTKGLRGRSATLATSTVTFRLPTTRERHKFEEPLC